jgi:hypothetical protein
MAEDNPLVLAVRADRPVDAVVRFCRCAILARWPISC